jgi:hypothetical protein
MPAPNLDRLHAAPESLLEWLEGNLLMSGPLQNVLNPPGTAWATVQPRQPLFPGGPVPVAVNQSGVPMDVFDLRSNGGGPQNGLSAYICNYTPNQHHSIDIANAADFCFTTNLNGCTFGIGPVANNTRRVTHSNRGGNTLLQRADIQAAHGAGPGLAGITLLEPAQYRRLGGGGALQATVFGIRNGLNWKFYFQSYTAVNGTNFQVHGVFPI